MKKILWAMIIASPILASADIIKCTFTEPFVSSEYSMTQSQLAYTNVEDKKTVIKNVSFQIKAAGVFELVKDGQVLQSLELNYKGSNGMSDHVYPYSVKDNNDITMQGYGGCVSNSLKALLPEDGSR